MFQVSTHRGDREFPTFDYAEAWATFIGKTYGIEGITITTGDQEWHMVDWYGKPKFMPQRSQIEATV